MKKKLFLKMFSNKLLQLGKIAADGENCHFFIRNKETKLKHVCLF